MFAALRHAIWQARDGGYQPRQVKSERQKEDRGISALSPGNARIVRRAPARATISDVRLTSSGRVSR
jgi:hypothetical protein